MSLLASNPRKIAAIHNPFNTYRVGVNGVAAITCVDDAGPGALIPYLHVFSDSDTEYPTLSTSADSWLIEYSKEMQDEPTE